MTRDTSIETYCKIKDSGLLSKRRFEVYSLLYEWGPLTGSQIVKRYHNTYKFLLHSGSIVTRISELRDRKVVKEVSIVVCPVTGNNVILWDVTGRLPEEPPKKKKRVKCEHCNGEGYVECTKTKGYGAA